MGEEEGLNGRSARLKMGGVMAVMRGEAGRIGEGQVVEECLVIIGTRVGIEKAGRLGDDMVE